jgi:hypothetical protein
MAMPAICTGRIAGLLDGISAEKIGPPQYETLVDPGSKLVGDRCSAAMQLDGEANSTMTAGVTPDHGQIIMLMIYQPHPYKLLEEIHCIVYPSTYPAV